MHLCRSAAYALRAHGGPPTIDSYQGHPFLAELAAKAQAESGGNAPVDGEGRPPRPATGGAPAGLRASAALDGGKGAGPKQAPPKSTASAPQLMDLLSLDEVSRLLSGATVLAALCNCAQRGCGQCPHHACASKTEGDYAGLHLFVSLTRRVQHGCFI